MTLLLMQGCLTTAIAILGVVLKESPRGEWPGCPPPGCGRCVHNKCHDPSEKGINRRKVWTHSAPLLFQQVSLARPHTPENLNKRSVHARLHGHASNGADITVSRSALTGPGTPCRVVKQPLLQYVDGSLRSWTLAGFLQGLVEALITGKVPEALGAQLYPFNFTRLCAEDPSFALPIACRFTSGEAYLFCAVAVSR